MIYILCKQNWQCFGFYYWIPHIIHLILLSELPKTISSSLSNQNPLPEINEKLSSNFFKITNTYTFSQFAEKLITKLENKNFLEEVDTSILNLNSFEYVEKNIDNKIQYKLTTTDNNINSLSSN